MTTVSRKMMKVHLLLCRRRAAWIWSSCCTSGQTTDQVTTATASNRSAGKCHQWSPPGHRTCYRRRYYRNCRWALQHTQIRAHIKKTALSVIPMRSSSRIRQHVPEIGAGNRTHNTQQIDRYNINQKTSRLCFSMRLILRLLPLL